MKNNNFKFTIRITWIIFLLCLAAIIKMIKVYVIDMRFDHEWDFLVYSIPVFISVIIFLMFLYNLKRAYNKQESELKESNCIAHWKYTEEEWSGFSKAEWKKSRNKSVAVPLGCLILFFIIGMIDKGFSSEGLAIAAPYVIIFLGSLSAILWFYNYMLYRRTKTCCREVLIGKHGFSFGAYYNSFELAATRFNGATLLPGNIPILQFNIETWSKYGYNPTPLRVPVPYGREGEAEKIAEELSRK